MRSGHALLGTTNLDLPSLTERFQTRFQSVRLQPPDNEALADPLLDIKVHGKNFRILRHSSSVRKLGWRWVALGGAGWRWVALGGAGWRWVALGGAGWRWVALGGAG
jgi:hypothetical protein